ncbi:MAG: hypothetical protein GEU88_06895 [Solirubrobacterales bacterium]|nr:hypothetical protein [Solirubrobacterales bacterium]
MEGSSHAQRIHVGGVLGETFSIYGRHAAALLGSAFLIFVVVGIVTALLSGPSRNEASWGELLLFLLAVIIRVGATALYTGFVVKLVEDARDGRRDVSIGRLFSSAATAIVPLVAMSILWGIGVGIGLFLFIIPGLLLLTIWAVTAPAIVVEGAGVLESFGRSRELVRGNGWRVFWTIVAVWLLSAVITFLLGLIGDAISGVGYGVAVTIAGFVTAPILALAASVMFFDLGGGRAVRAPAAVAPTTPPPAPAA